MHIPDQLPPWMGEVGALAVWGLLALGLFALALAILPPLGVLMWWSGWLGRPAPTPPATPPISANSPHPNHFLVYLSGMGDISGESSTRYEAAFLAAIGARVPQLAIVEDVFAFSVTNQGLTSQRYLGWFWRWVDTQRRKKGPLKIVGQLVFGHNILQIAVSADQRYGPVYNYGVAEMMLEGLIRSGYKLDSGLPINLLGFSGGGQIALGAAKYLQATLHVPIQVISLGGVMNSDRSLAYIDRLVHLYGTQDRLQRLGAVIFPRRWPIFPNSYWNLALAAGRISEINLGPMTHNGRSSYMDATISFDGAASYLDHSADVIARLIHDFDVRHTLAEYEV